MLAQKGDLSKAGEKALAFAAGTVDALRALGTVQTLMSMADVWLP